MKILKSIIAIFALSFASATYAQSSTDLSSLLNILQSNFSKQSSNNTTSNNTDNNTSNNSNSSNGLGDLGNIVGAVVNNILKTDNLDVADLAGTWRSAGPALSFESEDLLNKAGGVAMASTIEGKLAPYYKKMGLENMTFTFTTEGEVTITLKNGKKITGTVKKGEKEGTMVFTFSKLAKLGSLTAYVSKGSNLTIMFDATKLVNLVSAIAKYSNISSFSTIAAMLNSYKGVYAGFKFEK